MSHFILAAYYEPSHNIAIDIESYIKNYSNIYLLYGPELHFNKTTAISKGIELSTRISSNNYDILFNYTLSRCKYRDFISRYDKTHIFNISGNKKFDNGKSSFGFNWNFSSGFPYTPVVGKYPLIHNYSDNIFNNIFIPKRFSRKLYNGIRNSARYPVYHRLDISYKRYFETKKYKLTFVLQVLNVYNRKNHLAHYGGIADINNNFVYQKKFIGYFPRIPTIGLMFELK